ncbi:MAG: signal recognition particle-docking protein FtsY [Chloroflexi bacterium]|nr:signal recognition particle-docking protein FtsY [Chloroflexota bacterium]MCY3937325.1 signal recognition particle-docking protein FtsY [Chloroflexota bacterium]
MFKRLKRRRSGRDIEQGAAKSRRGFGSRLAGIFERSRITDADWEELEETLISGDVGLDLAIELTEAIRDRVKSDGIKDPDALLGAAREVLIDALRVNGVSEPPAGKPIVILVVGVNGSGKTTTVAKLAHFLQEMGKTSVLAAADTFRAGAIDQLEIWGRRLDLRVVAQAPGSDPAAVAFDAASAAVATKADYLIVDTAGRLQTNRNLMNELRKVRRVLAGRIESAPHEVLLVLDGLTGQNGLAQAREFHADVGVSGIVLAKLDSSAKGGVVFAVTKELEVPVKFAGTGESIEDLAPFDAEEFVDALMRSGN